MSQFKALLSGVAAASAMLGAALAAPVTVQDNPDNGASVFGTGLGRTVAIEHNGRERNVNAGVFSLQFKTDGAWANFLTFCLELSEWLTLPKLHEEIDGDIYFPDAADRRALGILYGDFMTPELGLKDATAAAAMQTIIWEIAEDGSASFDLNGGVFSVDSWSVREKADLFWALLQTGQHKPIGFNVFAARGTQDLLVPDVPAPGAIILFGSGLAAFAARRRRKSLTHA